MDPGLPATIYIEFTNHFALGLELLFSLALEFLASPSDSLLLALLARFSCRSSPTTLQKDVVRFLTTLLCKTGGAALQGRHDFHVQEFLLKPLFSSLILPLLLTRVSTRAPFPLLFLEIASPAGKRITLVGETILRGLPAPEEE